jgi:uncharacterized protein (DUF169 family)
VPIHNATFKFAFIVYILLVLQILGLSTACMFEKGYLFGSISEIHCKQYMETKRVTPFFYIIARLIRFVLMMEALWGFYTV